jgi:hypothetical protein
MKFVKKFSYNPRVKMFKTEASLVSAFKAEFAELFLKKVQSSGRLRRYVCLNEFNSQYGIADIVLAVFRPNIRVPKDRKPINHDWLSSLSQLPENRIISLKDYVSFFGISIRTAKRQLDNFTKASFVESLENFTYRVAREYTSIVDTTIAIEAKLRDWKKALRQAYRYKRFSNFSFVLLPAENANSAIQNIYIFKQYNIGLISIGQHGLTIHFAPIRIDSKSNDATLRVNESAYQEIIAA